MRISDNTHINRSLLDGRQPACCGWVGVCSVDACQLNTAPTWWSREPQHNPWLESHWFPAAVPVSQSLTHDAAVLLPGGRHHGDRCSTTNLQVKRRGQNEREKHSRKMEAVCIQRPERDKRPESNHQKNKHCALYHDTVIFTIPSVP
ncbi:uncharacterized protein V6R79_009020 [Siganus canaliculatus]